MYLHLGGKHLIPLKNVVAIIKLTGYKSHINKELLKIAALDKKIINLDKNIEPRSCVITTDKIYLSPVLTTTLIKRT